MILNLSYDRLRTRKCFFSLSLQQNILWHKIIIYNLWREDCGIVLRLSGLQVRRQRRTWAVSPGFLPGSQLAQPLIHTEHPLPGPPCNTQSPQSAHSRSQECVPDTSGPPSNKTHGPQLPRQRSRGQLRLRPHWAKSKTRNETRSQSWRGLLALSEFSLTKRSFFS